MINGTAPEPSTAPVQAARRSDTGKSKTRDRRPGWRAAGVLGTILLAGLGGTACSLDGLLDSEEIPPELSDPAITLTPAGARTAYVGTLSQFRAAFGRSDPNSFVAEGGMLTDELMDNSGEGGFGSVDRRHLPESHDPTIVNAGGVTYSELQKTRNLAGQAIQLLKRFMPEAPALAGHLYALQAYTEVFLAELYCSGIPLSTVDFEGDFTLKAGSSTADVFTHALALFDSALTLAADSARFVDLARVGRARALLALGQHANAAAAVSAVADGYTYGVAYSNAATPDVFGSGFNLYWSSFADTDPNNGGFGTWRYRVPNVEGTNGINWHGGDPRSKVFARGSYFFPPFNFGSVFVPLKYARLVVVSPTRTDTITDGVVPIALASGVEARLIEAEAALQAGDPTTWLDKLNHLRQTAITPALPDTTDPGTDDARINLMFRERALWLFLTGHRQGDLRRLMRAPYSRPQQLVYPTGSYPSGLPYGGEVTLPIPSTEFLNPLYTGCLSRSA